MPVLVPGVCGQAARSVRGLPVTCSAAYPKSSSASSFQALIALARSICTTATRTRPWARGRSAAGRAGPAARVPTGRSGRSSWNQTCLCVGVYSTPQRPARAAHSWRPRPPSRSGLPMLIAVGWRGISRSGYLSATSMRTPSSERRQRTSADVPACTTALVTSSLVRTTASSTMSAKPQPWRVSRTKDRAVATDRPTGSKLAAARAVITELLVRFSTCGETCDDPWPTSPCRGRGWFSVGRGSWGGPPGCSPVVMVRPPLRCLPACASCHRPGRMCRHGWTAACKVTYLRGPCGCRSAVFPPGVCADRVRSCRTVMAWFRQGETLGKL